MNCQHDRRGEKLNNELYDKIVRDRPYLWWWIKDKKMLSTEKIVEGVLSYGNMDDVMKLLQILGRKNTKEIFFKQISRKRHNYRPQTVNFFKKVFSRHV